MGNARMYQALRDYGDRIDTVGIFTFEVDITGTITETGTSISSSATLEMNSTLQLLMRRPLKKPRWKNENEQKSSEGYGNLKMHQKRIIL